MRIQILSGATLLWSCSGLVWSDSDQSAAQLPVASVRFEQNATDEDVEVVMRVKGRDQGLAKLVVTSPDGRTVINVSAPDASTLGMRQFRFESPEPKDVASLKSAYPEGAYSFVGTTTDGNKLHGQSTLSHKLPPPASFVSPKANARDLSADDLTISWTGAKDLAAFIIEIEQDDLDVNITAKLPGSVTTFVVPDGFLRPGTEYQLGIGTVTDEGNISFVETTFTTAP